MVGLRTLCSALVLAGSSATASAQGPSVPQPPTGTIVVDEAGLLDSASIQRIDALAAATLREKQIPIRVVTLRSLAARNAAGWTIERYARHLFNTWAIGSRPHNRGMLLLIAKGDRKARIELGADWGSGKHVRSQVVMDTLIVPAFKAGEFVQGIELGVAGLDAIARDAPMPRAPTFSGRGDRAMTEFLVMIVFVGVTGVIIFVVAWLDGRRKGKGAASGSSSSRSYSSSYSSSSYSSSFSSGGFSSGGGASGSW